MKIIEIIRSRIILFIIQISVLFLIVHLFEYKFDLNLSSIPPPINTNDVQIGIIEWLVNYIMYQDLTDLFFIFIIWVLISTIPIVIYNNYRKAYSMNLITFFFPNFFFYVFLFNYYQPYFNVYFLDLFIKTIILGTTIILYSIGLSLILKKIIDFRFEKKGIDLSDIARSGKFVCPKCGVEFESIPKVCYNCNTDLTVKDENTVGK
ncbi:MAG: hypothetical protein R3255_02980 [Candidatus Lokiarchaeia archaeon]|nr:hypothetical protein [Candidatus Lokiarchaeia archaeon]